MLHLKEQVLHIYFNSISFVHLDFESATIALKTDIHITLLLFHYISFSLALSVCLDGTSPGYHLHRGYGSGADSWLINLEVLIVLFHILLLAVMCMCTQKNYCDISCNIKKQDIMGEFIDY